MVVRLAVLGMNHGFKFAQDAQRLEGVELVAVADKTPQGHARAQQLQVRCYDEYQELLDKCEIDGVIISLPTPLHRQSVELSARKGVHVLVEKPIAGTIADGRAIIEACDGYGVKLLVGHHRRFSRHVEEARRQIAMGKIGTIVGGNLVWALAKDREYFNQAWRVKEGGGPLLINGIHDVDNLRYITGLTVQRVYAVTRNAIRRKAVEDSACVIFETREGATFTYFLSDGVPSPWAYEFNLRENPRYVEYDEICYQFFGTLGSLGFPQGRLYRYPDEYYGWDNPLEVECVGPEGNDPMTDELQHFVDVVRGLVEPRVTGPDGLTTLEVVLAIKRSAEMERPADV